MNECEGRNYVNKLVGNWHKKENAYQNVQQDFPYNLLVGHNIESSRRERRKVNELLSGGETFSS